MFEKHREEVLTQWRERITHKWQVDFGDHVNVIERRHSHGSKGN